MTHKKKIGTVAYYVVGILIAILAIIPFLWMVSTSLKARGALMSIPIEWIPKEPTIASYVKVFSKFPFFSTIGNSLFISVTYTFITLISASMAAFAFAKLKFPFRDKLFFIYIILLILPLQVTLVPDYMILENMNLLNNFLAVILPGTFSAFGICLLRQSIKYIPDSAIEAARVDGASYLKIFTNIILPQIKGGLITLALLCFIDNWNVVEQPLIYFDNEGMYPLSVTLTDVGSSDYGIIFACGVIFMIPALLIYLYGHRDIDSPFVGTDKG